METLINQLTDYTNIEFMNVAKNIVLSGIMSQLIYLTFLQFGRTLSNRKEFGSIFFMIAVSTTLIISIIKSSLALSLGLVGALSIVRFRTAVKEPEELAYLFLVITVGIGFGADTYLLTIVSTLVILTILIVRGLFFHKTASTTVYNLAIESKILTIELTKKILANTCDTVTLMRLDTHSNLDQSYWKVVFKSDSHLEKSLNTLKEADKDVSIQYSSSANVI